MRLPSKSLTVAVPNEHHNVEYRHFRIADILQNRLGDKYYNSHAECGQLNIVVNIYYRLYWAHALIGHYSTGRKYALIKKYALNKHVLLLTRLYGM